MTPKVTKLEQMGIDVNPDSVHWLVEYDLPAETRDVSDDMKAMLNSMRTQVWRMLRTKYHCQKLADSSWLVRNANEPLVGDITKLEAVKVDLEKFVRKYAKHGFTPNIVIFPMATNADGNQWVKRTALQGIWEELKKLDKRCDDYIRKGKVRLKVFNEMTETLKLQMDIFTEDYGKKHGDYWEFEKEYMRVMDKFMGTPNKKGLKTYATVE